MGNDLAAAVSERWPEVEAARAGLEALGAHIAQMTGSGAASFGAFDSRRAASRAASALREAGYQAWPCTTVDRRQHLLPV